MKLMVLDGNSLINRAYHGVRPLSTSQGLQTNAIFGFLTTLQRLTDEEKPDALCVTFDRREPTFRHRADEAYKAKRKPMDEELAMQFPPLKDVLDAMAIPRYELAGYEADDLIGTISRRCEADGWDCVIVTGDKDSLQLITDHTRVKLATGMPGRESYKDMTPETFREAYGFDPIHMIDLKALMGDASDNISGVPGIGEKTAMTLIQTYGSIDAVYAHIDSVDLRAGMLAKLRDGEAAARHSYWMATIVTDAPLEFQPADALRKPFKPELYDVFLRLEFQRFIDKYHLTPGHPVEAHREYTAAAEILTGEGRAEECLALWRQADHVTVYGLSDLSALVVSCETGEDSSLAVELYVNRYEGSWHDLLTALFSGSYDLPRLFVAYYNEELPKPAHLAPEAFTSLLGEDGEAQASLLSYTAAVSALHETLRPKLAERNVERLYYDVELPLCRVLADMETAGFLVDRKALAEFGEMLGRTMEETEQATYDAAGARFNINSPKQLGVLLFDKLHLPHGKKTKTGWSTNAEVLEKLRYDYPIVDSILRYRQYAKLRSTYVDGLLKVIDPDGRVRTSFQMTVTATGRLSSTEPNLQNIPTRTELGSRLRAMFTAAPGCVLVDADYSQIELRLLADMAGDTEMRDAFLSGADFHTVTAAKVFHLPPEQVTPELRRRAKAVNFGVVYGISAFSLAQDIGVTVQEAKDYMERYFATYTGVRQYMTDVVARAERDGFVETPMHRRRALPELKSSNHNLREFGKRVALNMPVQGAAADIIKIAMVRVHSRLRKEHLQARLLMQVHDELIVECPVSERERVERLLTEEMSRAAELSLPLIAEAHSGQNWLQAKE